MPLVCVLVVIASGVEIVGLLLALTSPLAKSVQMLDNVRASRALAAENKPQCDALARQLQDLTRYVEAKQRTQVVDLMALGGVWAAALGQLGVDMAAVENKLSTLGSTRSRSGVMAALVDLKNAREVRDALQFVEMKLSAAWGKLQSLDFRQHTYTQHDHLVAKIDGPRDVFQSELRGGFAALAELLRDQAKSDAVMEQVLKLKEDKLLLVRVSDIVEDVRLALRSAEPNDLNRGGSGSAGDAVSALCFDYESEREKLEKAQPRLLRC